MANTLCNIGECPVPSEIVNDPEKRAWLDKRGFKVSELLIERMCQGGCISDEFALEAERRAAVGECALNRSLLHESET